MKKGSIGVVIACSLFLLIGCMYGDGEGETPEEAIENLPEASISRIYEPVLKEEAHALYVVRGQFGEGLEPESYPFFIAYLQQKGKKWAVVEAVGLQEPSAERLNAATGGNLLLAGYKRGNETYPQQHDVRYVFELDDSEFEIWIELKEESYEVDHS
ncbi:hypothetical protein M3212_12835 [Alkalihalobacillus oceani]|uniref:hypothetical protein n=1 Tax=Halalkalibacter oceani TaxID=1653776 RepID=UPI00203A4B91|nr:hypothetical protein [Halalkalibacter oceani]MCM3761673.1 hypothetical protein [Halalkalibacter oceani]